MSLIVQIIAIIVLLALVSGFLWIVFSHSFEELISILTGDDDINK